MMVACLTGISTVGGGIALADELGSSEEGAKGLFFQQMKSKEKINTGLQYWIELQRGGQTLKVNSKHQFVSGDRIRFHVRSNIDGFAYILLSSGSRGEKCVLFPNDKSNDDNKVVAGKDYDLPGDGYLTFDKNPGTEKVTLLLSRGPIDAKAYFNEPKEEATLIASVGNGSKDLVPSKIVVAYNSPAPAPKITADDKQSVDVTISSKGNERVTTVPKNAVTRKIVLKHQPSPSTTSATSNATHNDDGVVTVVKKDPAGVLHVDVALKHD